MSRSGYERCWEYDESKILLRLAGKKQYHARTQPRLCETATLSIESQKVKTP
jgi:hypothetical protein